MVRIPTRGAPTRSDEMLLEELLRTLVMTQTELAERINAPINRVDKITTRKRGITAETGAPT